MRTCLKCGEFKPDEMFGFSASTTNRLNVCRVCKKVYQDAYRSSHREKINQQVRNWHAVNQDKVKAWKKANPESKRASQSRRRMQKSIAMTRLDMKKTRIYRKIIKNNPCHYCGKITPEMHDDHLMPLVRGGTDHWWNIVRACSTCNLRKQSKLATQFELTSKA